MLVSIYVVLVLHTPARVAIATEKVTTLPAVRNQLVIPKPKSIENVTPEKVQEVNDDSTDSNSSSDEFFIGAITLDDPESHVVNAINDSDPPPLLDEYDSDYDYQSSDECSTSDSSSSDLPDSLSVDPVEKDWTIDLETNGTDVTYKIDSGSYADVIPIKNIRKFCR